VPVAAHNVLSGLAAQVANTLCASRGPDTSGARTPDIVIFCHSSLDEHVSSTAAGRLRAVLGAPCFAFSVSQQQGASVFTALRLASDLLTAEPDVSTILVVAAEKWHPPFSRMATPYLLQGDAAGALLIERASDTVQGLRVLDASTARTGSRAMSRLHYAPGVARAWAPPLISLIAQMLASHGPLERKIDEVVGHRGSAFLTHAVCEYLGREDRRALDEHHVHLGAAETIVRLAERLHHVALPQQARLLLWGFGLGGYVGGALLEAHGAPHVTLEEHA
jgi:3-oxoacyl-[acyl-carrier-protein] synthase III